MVGIELATAWLIAIQAGQSGIEASLGTVHLFSFLNPCVHLYTAQHLIVESKR